jgi:methylthioribose-1-phosphate isomerase
MLIGKQKYHTIWLHPDNPGIVQVIDQRLLPHRFIIRDITSPEAMAEAICNMAVRGAPLIGVAAAFGYYLGIAENRNPAHCYQQLLNTRPTAINLRWALDTMHAAVAAATSPGAATAIALETAQSIKAADITMCYNIGQHGLPLIEKIAQQKNGAPVNILTHCNAGWLACTDWGTATSAIYQAHAKGINLHIWVDETRPRNQGASLTAFELGEEGIPHTLIADNTGGHLMQHGMVDMVITGADRVTANGDAANKIGTYLKALAAKDNQIPFYIAIPASSIDWNLRNGISEIPIEERDMDEVRYVYGLHEEEVKPVLVCPQNTKAVNYGFDVTPARLITGIITERGITAPAALRALYQ